MCEALASRKALPLHTAHRVCSALHPKNKACLCCCVPARSYEDAAGVLSWVEQKIAAVTLLPVSHGEVRAGHTPQSASAAAAAAV
jgi:hypothetical protein